MRILISRTDSIGDVVLTLPLAGFLKEINSNCTVIFLGKTYTKPIIDLSEHIDEFINWDELEKIEATQKIDQLKSYEIDVCLHVFPRKEIAQLVKKAGIKTRIGTTGRLYHWFNCNKLVKFSRKNSDLHESQLNTKLLKPLGFNQTPTLEEIEKNYGFNQIPDDENKDVFELIDPKKFNLILHPKSKGSAVEWGLENFLALIQELPERKFNIFISGTTNDSKLIAQEITSFPNHIHNITGKLSLIEFIGFINRCDGLVAASTGPLHIAAALGKIAIGLFSPVKPIHPGRWKPIGKKAIGLVHDEHGEDFSMKDSLALIQKISPKMVVEAIQKFNS